MPSHPSTLLDIADAVADTSTEVGQRNAVAKILLRQLGYADMPEIRSGTAQDGFKVRIYTWRRIPKLGDVALVTGPGIEAQVLKVPDGQTVYLEGAAVPEPVRRIEAKRAQSGIRKAQRTVSPDVHPNRYNPTDVDWDTHTLDHGTRDWSRFGWVNEELSGTGAEWRKGTSTIEIRPQQSYPDRWPIEVRVDGYPYREHFFPTVKVAIMALEPIVKSLTRRNPRARISGDVNVEWVDEGPSGPSGPPPGSSRLHAGGEPYEPPPYYDPSGPSYEQPSPYDEPLYEPEQEAPESTPFYNKGLPATPKPFDQLSQHEKIERQDELDAMYQERIVAVRNALRNLGWDIPRDSMTGSKDGHTVTHRPKEVGAGRNIVGVTWLVDGGTVSITDDPDAVTPAMVADTIDIAIQSEPTSTEPYALGAAPLMEEVQAYEMGVNALPSSLVSLPLDAHSDVLVDWHDKGTALTDRLYTTDPALWERVATAQAIVDGMMRRVDEAEALAEKHARGEMYQAPAPAIEPTNDARYDAALDHFVRGEIAKIKARLGLSYTIGTEHRRKYTLVFHTDPRSDSRSALWFVDKKTGDVFKAATWKQAAPGRRGTIYPAVEPPLEPPFVSRSTLVAEGERQMAASRAVGPIYDAEQEGYKAGALGERSLQGAVDNGDDVQGIELIDVPSDSPVTGTEMLQAWRNGYAEGYATVGLPEVDWQFFGHRVASQQESDALVEAINEAWTANYGGRYGALDKSLPSIFQFTTGKERAKGRSKSRSTSDDEITLRDFVLNVVREYATQRRQTPASAWHDIQDAMLAWLTSPSALHAHQEWRDVIDDVFKSVSTSIKEEEGEAQAGVIDLVVNAAWNALKEARSLTESGSSHNLKDACEIVGELQAKDGILYAAADYDFLDEWAQSKDDKEALSGLKERSEERLDDEELVNAMSAAKASGQERALSNELAYVLDLLGTACEDEPWFTGFAHSQEAPSMFAPPPDRNSITLGYLEKEIREIEAMAPAGRKVQADRDRKLASLRARWEQAGGTPRPPARMDPEIKALLAAESAPTPQPSDAERMAQFKALLKQALKGE